MAMVSDFMSAVHQICSERGIEAEEVFVALEEAVLAAYKKDHPEENASVEMDRETGEFKVIAQKVVVKKVANKSIEISIKEAQKMEKSLKEGDTIEIEMPVADFGRIAAQTAKQVVLQKIRESEKEAVLKEFSDKVGEVFNALMQRMQNGKAVFEIGKALVYMPLAEQVPSEFYKIGERYKVLLKSIEDTPSGKELIVSRAAPDFLKELFKLEVPEIESGVVEVKSIAREAGSRSKMAVISHQEGVDPIGSCVGQRGIRIANVMGELGEEKIDIIEWNEDEDEFVANALSPAKVISVDIDGDTARVVVADDQLSLAIGREGQNARLAAKLTNKKIDIQGETAQDIRPVSGTAPSSDIESPLIDLSPALEDQRDDKKAKTSAPKATKLKKSETGLDKSLAAKLEKAGKTPADVEGWTVEQLMELDGIGKVTAEKIHKAINK